MIKNLKIKFLPKELLRQSDSFSITLMGEKKLRIYIKSLKIIG